MFFASSDVNQTSVSVVTALKLTINISLNGCEWKKNTQKKTLC